MNEGHNWIGKQVARAKWMSAAKNEIRTKTKGERWWSSDKANQNKHSLDQSSSDKMRSGQSPSWRSFTMSGMQIANGREWRREDGVNRRDTFAHSPLLWVRFATFRLDFILAPNCQLLHRCLFTSLHFTSPHLTSLYLFLPSPSHPFLFLSSPPISLLSFHCAEWLGRLLFRWPNRFVLQLPVIAFVYWADNWSIWLALLFFFLLQRHACTRVSHNNKAYDR